MHTNKSKHSVVSINVLLLFVCPKMTEYYKSILLLCKENSAKRTNAFANPRVLSEAFERECLKLLDFNPVPRESGKKMLHFIATLRMCQDFSSDKVIPEDVHVAHLIIASDEHTFQ